MSPRVDTKKRDEKMLNRTEDMNKKVGHHFTMCNDRQAVHCQNNSLFSEEFTGLCQSRPYA